MRASMKGRLTFASSTWKCRVVSYRGWHTKNRRAALGRTRPHFTSPSAAIGGRAGNEGANWRVYSELWPEGSEYAFNMPAHNGHAKCPPHAAAATDLPGGLSR